MSLVKRVAIPITPDALGSLWRLLGRIFGRRRSRLVIHPILGTAVAIADTVSLLSIIRLLLLLVDQADSATLSIGPIDWTFSFNELVVVALAAVVTTLVVRLVEGRIATRNQAFAIREARRLAIDAWFAADWEQLHAVRLGRLQQLLGVNAQHAAVPVQVVSVTSVAAISLVVYVAIVLVSAPVIAVLFAVVAVGSAALLNPIRRRSKRLASTHSSQLGELQLNATSYAQLNRELHVFGVQDQAAARLDELSASTAYSFAKLKFIQRVLPSVYQQLLLAAIVGIVLAGRAIDVDAVRFGTAAILAVRSLTYIQQLNSSFQTFVETRPFLEELLDSVTESDKMRRQRGTAVLEAVQSITLHEVGYRYPTGTLALDGVDLELTAGDWLGVIGPSGGGKTTFANLIAGLLTATDGSVLVNGHPVREYSARSWTAQFGLLSQEPVLLAATVAENIAFHRPATPEDVRAAAVRAGVEREVDALPEGFDTPVGEGRASLSGGQRQRLALARCLLGSPSCLILDEPTSALDAANEALVEGSLLEISPDAIVIVVSHRRALLSRCNRFLVLEHGRVVARGGPDDVDLAGRVGAR